MSVHFSSNYCLLIIYLLWVGVMMGNKSGGCGSTALIYPYYDKNMRKKSQTSKFLESCYFKFRAHRSLSAVRSNPLLVPNLAKGNSLCPASTKKHSSFYHHRTLLDWTSKESPETDHRKSAQQTLGKKQVKNMEGAMIVSRLQNSLPSEKAGNQLKCGKKEKVNKILKLKSCSIHPEKIQSMTFQNETIKNLLSTDDSFAQSQGVEDPMRSRSQGRRVQAQERRHFWKRYPNKHNSSQETLRNESSFTFRGWDAGLPENEEISNLHGSKHNYRL